MFKYYLQLSWLSLKRNPLLSLMMVLAVAMGIASNLTMLTIYSVMSNNPMAHKNTRIAAVQLNSWGDKSGYYENNGIPVSLTYQDAKAIYDANVAQQVVLTSNTGVTINTIDAEDRSSVEETRLVTRDFFAMFDVQFIYGAPWSILEDSDAEQVVVLSEYLNDKLFAGQNSVGKAVILDGVTYTVVAVVSDNWHISPSVYDLYGKPFRAAPKLYLPFFNVQKRIFPNWGNTVSWRNEDIRTLSGFLASEVVWIYTWAGFSSEENKASFQQFLSSYIKQQHSHGRFPLFQDYHLQSPAQWLEIFGVVNDDDRMLLGFSFAFLLVCLMNTSVLLFAKFSRNAPEAGLRRALGANSQSIFFQHMTEAALITCAGAVLGLLLSAVGLEGVRKMYASYNSIATVNSDTYVFAVALAVFTGLMSGFLPALKISLTVPALYLKTE
jgi:putative ABC transport system permease protein